MVTKNQGKGEWTEFAHGTTTGRGKLRVDYSIGGYTREAPFVTLKTMDEHGRAMGDWRGVRLTPSQADALLDESIALDIAEAVAKVREGAEQERKDKAAAALKAEFARLADLAKTLGVDPAILAGQTVHQETVR